MTLADDAAALRKAATALRSGPIKRSTITAQATAIEGVAGHLEAFQPVPTPAPAPSPSAQLRGFNIPIMDGDVDLDRAFADAKAAGATGWRGTVLWRLYEPSRGVYDTWQRDRLDAAISKSVAAGLAPILCIGTAPQWANGSSDWWRPPTNPADYGAFFGYVAGRYGTRVAAYEVWNEPNLGPFWGGAPNAAQYVALVKAARAAAPNAHLLAGSLSSTVVDWLGQLYASGIKGQFDGLALHPYVWMDPAPGGSPDDTGYPPMSYAGGVPAIRAAMLAQGDDKPIWFTEMGFSTLLVSEQTQAQYLAREWALAKGWPYVRAAMVYELYDTPKYNPSVPDTDKEAHFGVYRKDGTPKPAVAALAAVPT